MSNISTRGIVDFHFKAKVSAVRVRFIINTLDTFSFLFSYKTKKQDEIFSVITEIIMGKNKIEGPSTSLKFSLQHGM